MRVIAVDDEPINLEIFRTVTEGLEDTEIVGMFQKPQAALDYVENNRVDAAVLDVIMPEMDGIELGRRIHQINPDVALIYATCYREYAYDAFRLDACAYLLKPFDREEMLRALSKAVHTSQSSREPVQEILPEKKEIDKFEEPSEESADETPVFVRTFGKFDVFLNNRPLDFSSEKAKEMLALLVDRKGGIVSTEEMITYLWEDRPNDGKSRALCRKVEQRLQKQLKEYGIDDIIIRHSRGRSLDVNKVQCDYYQYMDGSEDRQSEFRGAYMDNYSWGEETLAWLLSK